jgi:hypothetical protein
MRWRVTRATSTLAGFLACLAFPRPAAAQWPVIWHATAAPILALAQNDFVPADLTAGGEWRRGSAGIGVDVSWFYFPPVAQRLGATTVIEPAGSAPPLIALLGAYHVGQPGCPPTVQPYLDAGLGVWASGPGLILEMGGGADWWLTSRVGIRTAVRNELSCRHRVCSD